MTDSKKDHWPKKALTIYLGESGEPLDSNRVDIITGESLVVSVDTKGIRVSNLKEDGRVLQEIMYSDLQDK